MKLKVLEARKVRKFIYLSGSKTSNISVKSNIFRVFDVVAIVGSEYYSYFCIAIGKVPCPPQRPHIHVTGFDIYMKRRTVPGP